MSRARRALITGGAGFIGSHLAERLVQQGVEVTVLDDLSTGVRDNLARVADSVRFRLGSVTDQDLVDRAAEGADVIYHLAASVGLRRVVDDPVGTLEVNVDGTKAVLHAAKRTGARVLIASTSEVYGKGVRVPFAEDDDVLLGPTTSVRWSYAVSKMVDEHLALAFHREHRVPVVVARFFNTIGPRQTGRYGMVVPRFVEQALLSQPITVYGEGGQSRCFCNVSDVVEAVTRLVETDGAAGKVFNVGSMEEISINELARRIVSAVRSAGVETRSAIRHMPYDAVYGLGFEDLQRRVPDIRRIEVAIGWRPRVALEETIRQVIEEKRVALQHEVGRS